MLDELQVTEEEGRAKVPSLWSLAEDCPVGRVGRWLACSFLLSKSAFLWSLFGLKKKRKSCRSEKQ